MTSVEAILRLTPRKAYRKLVRELFDEALRSGKGNFPQEKLYLVLAAELNWEALNGGILQYFIGPLCARYEEALEALHAIGAPVQEAIVKKWLSHLPPTVNPCSSASVALFVFTHADMQNELQKIDLEYYAQVNSFYDSFVSYAVRNAKAIGLVEKA